MHNLFLLPHTATEVIEVPLVVVSGTNSTAAAYFDPDARDWTATTLPSLGNWVGLAYGNGRWVAIKRGSNKCAFTINGIDWSEGTMPESRNWQGIAYSQDAGLFVAAYQLVNATTVATSPDGETWTARTIPTTTTISSAYAAYVGTKVFITAAGVPLNLVSEDCITWTSVVTGMANAPSRICYCSGIDKAVIMCAGNPIFWMSLVGDHESYEATNSSNPGIASDMCASSDRFFATFASGFGVGGSKYGDSSNADDWTFTDGLLGPGFSSRFCAFTGREFVAIGVGLDTSYHSEDLVSFDTVTGLGGQTWQAVAAAKELPW